MLGRPAGPPLHLSFNRQLDVDRLFFFAQGATQFRQSNILQLTNALAGDAKFLANLLERLWLSAIESEALKNNFLFTIVENVKQSADFVAQVFVAQKLKRRLRVLIADDFAEFGRIVIADRRIQ